MIFLKFLQEQLGTNSMAMSSNQRTLYECKTSRLLRLLLCSSLIQLCVSTPIDTSSHNGIHARDDALELFSALELQLDKSLTKLKEYMLFLDTPLAEDVELAFRDDEASYPEVVQKSESYPEIASKSDAFWEFD